MLFLAGKIGCRWSVLPALVAAWNFVKRQTFVCSWFLGQAENLLCNHIAHDLVGAASQSYTGRKQYCFLKVCLWFLNKVGYF